MPHRLDPSRVGHSLPKPTVIEVPVVTPEDELMEIKEEFEKVVSIIDEFVQNLNELADRAQKIKNTLSETEEKAEDLLSDINTVKEKVEIDQQIRREHFVEDE